MKLEFSAPFDPASDAQPLLDSIPSRAAVFVLSSDPAASPPSPPYVSRTRDLHRRLVRLLAKPRENSKLLNLRHLVRQIDYQPVGSNFEAQWLLYHLNRRYYPESYRERLRLRAPFLLKVNLRNRFPRCYLTRRLSPNGSLYYGPFPSRSSAERFASDFLDLFKIRRCVDDLHPDPSFPGCIYSQMKMCLAPCFAGCTDEEYQRELDRVVAFLDTEGQSLAQALEAERAAASDQLEFERAAKVHQRIENLQQVLRLRPELARNLRDLNAVMILPAAAPRNVTFFRVSSGEIRGPATLSLDDKVSSPIPLDQQLHALLDSLVPGSSAMPETPLPAHLPPWEHLSLLGRWYYSSFREGELLMLPKNQQIPHARLIRTCRKLISSEGA